MARPFTSSLEPLEDRIAPASLAVFHPIADVIPSVGQTGTTINLANSFDASSSAGYRTHLVITTNYDIDPVMPGLQPGKIVLELFDDTAPLTVANFLDYVKGADGDGSYLNTFFHRSVAGFVLQGGGYVDTAPTTHIAVGAPVHNEYDASDAERSNTAGTVAMAKSGTDPNSATSEFFFNLVDNNASNPSGNNLDALNGGFTVFAKVISGMDVVNAIANLPEAQIGLTGGAGGGTPYQNGYIPSSTLPKASQLVDITGVQIVKPTASKLPGVTYSLVSVVDEISGLSSNLVTGKVTGSNLALHYTPGASGEALVTVQAHSTATGQDVLESFHVQLAPNLIGAVVSDTLPGATSATYLQQGDTGMATVKVTNHGLGASTGLITVNYYLSADSGDSLDSDGTHYDANDLLIGSFTTPNAVTLGSGKSMNFTAPLAIPAAEQAALAAGNYHLVADIVTSNTDTLHGDHFTDDNSATGSDHQLLTGPGQAHLAAASLTENLPVVLVPGETGQTTLTVLNQTQVEAQGSLHVDYYLVSNPDPSSAADSFDRTLIGSSDYAHLDLKVGQTTKLTGSVVIPPSLDLATTGTGTLSYHVIAVIAGTDSSGQPFATTFDTVGENLYHPLQDIFGTVAETVNGKTVQRRVPITYLDADNRLVTLKMTGPGQGTVRLDADGGIVWQTQGTTAASALVPTLAAAAGDTLPAGAHTVVKDILIGTGMNDPIGTLPLGLVDLRETLSALGGVKTLTLGNTVGEGDHFIGLGGTTGRPTVTLGSVQDLSLDSSRPLTLLSAATWLSADGHSHAVTAPGIDTFKVAGDFTANLTLAPLAPTTAQLVKTFRVGGTVSGASLSIDGNVGTLAFGALEGSTLLVGAPTLPASADQFDGQFTVARLQLGALAHSEVAAAKFGAVVLAAVNGVNQSNLFGLVTERIATYTHTENGVAVARGANLTYASTAAAGHVFDVETDYQVTLLDVSRRAVRERLTMICERTL